MPVTQAEIAVTVLYDNANSQCLFFEVILPSTLLLILSLFSFTCMDP